MLTREPDWAGLLDTGLDDKALDSLRMHARTGRPLGGGDWLETLETTLGRRLRPGKPGRPRRQQKA